MNGPVSALGGDVAADGRWNEWLQRGANDDRRRGVAMGWLITLVSVMAGGWLMLQLF